MSLNIFNSTAWQLILQSDWVCRFVLLGLFVLSVYCTAIIIYKTIIFIKHIKHLKFLSKRLRQISNFQELIEVNKEFKETLGGSFLHSSLNELKRIVEKQKSDQKNISAKDFDILELSTNQEITSILEDEEVYIPVLSTSYAVSPLAGLFGTIWGLIHSFIDIAQEKSADISTIAPGLAEALTTTLAGLIVAIPALVAYHYLTHQLHKIEAQLVDINEKFLKIVKETLGE
ncbi:MAG: Transport protein [candidate division TM6 bacterium GW2011_GWF2_37_49]|nr:MAG: Transport protein [candidate division TM6 bacterium GW2011_GWF2_37_49]